MLTRTTIGVLSILLLAAGLGGQTLPGVQAQGRVTLMTAQGSVTGAITVSFAAPDRCKAVVDLSSPARRRQITAVFDGAKGLTQGPARLLNAAPLPIGPRVGCAFLAPRPASAAVTLRTADVAAHAASLTWDRGKHAISLVYQYPSLAAALPSSLTETVDGTERLKITFISHKERTFTSADFDVPAGGAQ